MRNAIHATAEAAALAAFLVAVLTFAAIACGA